MIWKLYFDECWDIFWENCSKYDLIVYKDLDQNEVLYTINKNDLIEVFEFLWEENGHTTIAHVKGPDGQIGYYFITGNFFNDGKYNFIETIEFNGDKKDVYSIQANVFVYNDYIKSIPFEGGEDILFDCEKTVTYKVTAVTDDEEWVKIDTGSIQGWIKSIEADSGKGGVWLHSPYSEIMEHLFHSSMYI